MNYKYEEVENVEVKESFEVHKHDDDFEKTETLKIPVGIKGTVVSMGCSSIDNFVNHYDIEFEIDGDIVDVSIYEGNMGKYLTFN